MVFLSPIFLLGLFAALIPIVIHLIRKEKPPKLMFGTIRFLKKTSKKLILFQHIQQWLLLLLRASLIALLVFAFARPLINQSVARLVDVDPASVIIVLDNSMSMQYGQRFETARAEALDILDDLDQSDEVGLIVFSDGVEQVQELTTDLESIRSQISNIEQAGFGGTLFMPNLRLADQLLNDSQFDNRSVYLISDFQAAGLDEAEADWNLAPGIAFRGVNVAQPESRNLALTDVRAPDRLLEGAAEQQILARVRSTGSVYLDQSEVSLYIDDALVDRQRVDLSDSSEGVATFTASFETPGIHRARVSVSGDEFDADNHYYLTIVVAQRINVLVVNGEASDNWYDDEGHWFGLAVSSAVISPFNLLSIEPNELTSEILQEHDVAALLNVSGLSNTQAAALNDYVMEGGSLLIAPGDRVDAQQFNQQLASITPAILGDATEAYIDDYHVIAEMDRRHPILRPLTNDWTARFNRHWQLIPNENSEVLMQFDNRSPALVQMDAGEGRVILFASTMDLEWNNLALQGMYLPFVHETLRFLVEPEILQTSFQIGDPINLTSSNGEYSLSNVMGTDTVSLDSMTLTAERPGIIETESVSGELMAFAVNALPVESNLTSVAPETINDLIINPETSPVQSREVRTAQIVADLERPQRVWWWILLLVIVLLLTEAKIANQTYR